MGCDIHFFIEKLVNGKWQKQNVKEKHYGRNYVLFGALAGVRNDLFKPPIPLRGFPKDASSTLKKIFEADGGDAHTPSYMSIEELYSLKHTKTNIELILSLDNYREFLINPKGYHSFLLNDEVNQEKTISAEEANRRINLTAFDNNEKIFVKVDNITLENFAGDYFYKQVDENIAKYTDNSKLRCVFWFDN